MLQYVIHKIKEFTKFSLVWYKVMWQEMEDRKIVLHQPSQQ